MTVVASRMVPPQKWPPPPVPCLTETCHGMGVGAFSPPTILSALVIQVGNEAHPPDGGGGFGAGGLGAGGLGEPEPKHSHT